MQYLPIHKLIISKASDQSILDAIDSFMTTLYSPDYDGKCISKY